MIGRGLVLAGLACVGAAGCVPFLPGSDRASRADASVRDGAPADGRTPDDVAGDAPGPDVPGLDVTGPGGDADIDARADDDATPPPRDGAGKESGAPVDLGAPGMDGGGIDVPREADVPVPDAAAPDVFAPDAPVRDAGPDPMIPPPRPVAPLSTATVTSRRPLLRWALAAGTDGAAVEICRDRACASVVSAFDAAGVAGMPPADLPPGTLYWRLRGRAAGRTGTASGPTWQFVVGARSAATNASWGAAPDVNGDGHADVVVGGHALSMVPGRAYLYLGAAGGLPSAPATTLVGPDGVASGFGYAVAAAGDVDGDGFCDLVVGAHAADGETGRVHVYRGGTGGLATTPTTSVTGPDGRGGQFGFVVAGAGDVNGDGYADVVVGACRAERAHVLLGGRAGLATRPAVSLAARVATGSGFGCTVAGAGDVNGDGYADIVVGAPGGAGVVGAVHLYLGAAAGPAADPALSIASPGEPGERFGAQVAGAVDVDGDGRADVVVGAPQGSGRAGRVYVYRGTATGLASSGAFVTAPGDPLASFGEVVAGAGDVDGDGFGDVVVGTRGAGRAFVFRGGASGLAAPPAVAFTPPMDANGDFGRPVAGAGDVNGDGLPDLLVGASPSTALPGAGSYPGSGRVYLYLGDRSGPRDTPAATLARPLGDFGFYGHAVAALRGLWTVGVWGGSG